MRKKKKEDVPARPQRLYNQKRLIDPAFISRHGDVIPELVNDYGQDENDVWWAVDINNEPLYEVRNPQIIERLNEM